MLIFNSDISDKNPFCFWLKISNSPKSGDGSDGAKSFNASLISSIAFTILVVAVNSNRPSG